MRILVVDDDPQIVRTTCDILRIKGYQPIPAFSGEAAVEHVRASAPDCVLMDIKMPGISGVEALKLMKALVPRLPVVLVSAYATDELVAEARSLGAQGVLGKPVNFQAILSFLETLREEESILVVDDDPAFCRTLGDILSMRGYRVETETDPDKVLEHLRASAKLMVLLDLKLGTRNGIDVLREVRARFPAKPVVLITGYREEMAASIAAGLAIGAYAVLYKPVEIDSLTGVIEEISRKRSAAILGG